MAAKKTATKKTPARKTAGKKTAAKKKSAPAAAAAAASTEPPFQPTHVIDADLARVFATSAESSTYNKATHRSSRLPKAG